MKTKFLSLILVAAIALPLSVFAGSEDLPAFSGRMLTTATAPSNGTNEIQSLTFGATITSGTFKLKFDGKTTAAITWTATDATLVSRIDTALEALPTVGTGGVTTAIGTISSGVNGTITVTFTGNRAKQDVPLMTVADNSLVGAAHTLTAATTTAGVSGDGRIVPKGTLCVAADTGFTYVNEGTPPNPTWVQILNGDTGTATATAGAATLSKMSGVVTSEALTTAGLADYTLTLTNTLVTTASKITASVSNGTNTQGTLGMGPITPGTGSATIIVHNLHATQALNGTIKIAFEVVP